MISRAFTNSNQGCKSGIGPFLTPWIRDPEWKKIRIRDEHPRSFFRELRDSLQGYLTRIRFREKEYFWPWIRDGKVRIRDKHQIKEKAFNYGSSKFGFPSLLQLWRKIQKRSPHDNDAKVLLTSIHVSFIHKCTSKRGKRPYTLCWLN